MKYSIYILSLLVVMVSCSEDQLLETSSGAITGTVIADGTNVNLENVKISTQPSTSTIFTNTNGVFTISDIADESYSVQADLDGYISQFEVANVTNGTTVELFFELMLEETANNPPSIPELIFPKNNAVDIETDVVFMWSSIDENESDEVNYTISLFNDSNDEVALFNEIIDTTLTVDSLLASTRYFWQVSADDGVNEAVQSPLFNFQTITSPEADILFVKKINGNNVIFSGTEDEEAPIFALTSEAENCWRPRKNAITGKIAFLKTIGGATHLFTMDANGGNQLQVTQNVPVNGFDFNEIDFSWKPEGDKLLYPSFSRLYSINTDGSGQAIFYETTNGNFITEIDWSDFNNVIALKTNDSNGYNVEIFTIDLAGTLQDMILQGVPGGAGGLDLNIDGSLLLYTYDISGIELTTYLPQDMRMFLHDITTGISGSQLLTGVTDGFNDVDPSFTPNENSVIFSRRGVSAGASTSVLIHEISGANENFDLLFDNTSMPDWE